MESVLPNGVSTVLGSSNGCMQKVVFRKTNPVTSQCLTMVSPLHTHTATTATVVLLDPQNFAKHPHQGIQAKMLHCSEQEWRTMSPYTEGNKYRLSFFLLCLTLVA